MSVSFNQSTPTVNQGPGDPIENLPTDKTVPSHTEIQIVDTLFKQKQTTIQNMLAGTKDVLIVGFVFAILSIPQIDPLITKLVPITATSPYIMLLVKTLIMMIVYFVLKNLYLVRNK